MRTIAKVALIVGAAVAVASGVGAIVGGAAFLAATGVSLATVAAIGAVAGLVGTVANLLVKPKAGSVSGSLTDFKLDPSATIPIMFGRTFNGGNVVHRDSWGTDNQYQGFIVVYSGCGPIAGIEGFYSDRSLVTFDGAGAATGAAFGPGGKGPWMWFRSQLGNTPEPAALQPAIAGMPGWTAQHKLSGYAAGALVLKFDKDGKKYQGGVPATGIVGLGVKAWDPRRDDTYPGGSGACRRDNPATWIATRNPWILALQFALGWYENGYLVGGVGSRGSSIILSDYVAAANVADANGWTTSGVRATGDPKWDTLKLLCEAGGGEPIWLGAALSCMGSTPRVSVATISTRDLRGPISTVGTQTRRGGRINTGIPNYRSEAHGWEMIPASAIPVSTYIAEDGGKRTKEITFALVSDINQAAQLTAYSIVNGREFGPIEIKLDPRWIGLQPGMAIDLNVPESALNGQQCVVIARSIEPATGMVSLTLRSETKQKHAFALASVSTAPPTPSLGAPDYPAAALAYETAGQAAVFIRNSAPRDVNLASSIPRSDVTFDFTGGAMPANTSIARNSTGTRFNAAGVLVSEAVNAPRFDYAGGVLLGLLVEPTRTNVAQRNSLTTTNCSAAAAADPTGANNGFTLSVNGNDPYAGVNRNGLVIAGKKFAKSVYARQGDSKGATPYFALYSYDNNVSAVDAPSFAVPAAFARFQGVVDYPAGKGPGVNVRVDPFEGGSAGNNPPAGATMTFALMQLEEIAAGERAEASSPIIASGADATRQADVVTLNWGALGVGDQNCTIRYTFDDNSTQDVASTIANGTSTIPTNLTRARIRKATALQAYASTAVIDISAHVRDYPDRQFAIPANRLTGVPTGKVVLVYYDDQSRSNAAPAMLWTLSYEEAVNSATTPYRHYVGLVQTATQAGGSTAGDPPPYPGGGGYCVHEDTLVRVYGADGDRDVRAAELRPGMMVRTLREEDLANGVYPISAVEIVRCDDAWTYVGEEGPLTGSAGHRVWIEGDWRRLDEVGVRAEACNVVAISVPGARTYVSAGYLSHNIKMTENQVQQ